MQVKVKGLDSRPEQNGHRGTLLDFDASEGRWRVVMDDGLGLSLRPVNLAADDLGPECRILYDSQSHGSEERRVAFGGGELLVDLQMRRKRNAEVGLMHWRAAGDKWQPAPLLRAGTKIEVQKDDLTHVGAARNGTIDGINYDGSYRVRYEDGHIDPSVASLDICPAGSSDPLGGKEFERSEDTEGISVDEVYQSSDEADMQSDDPEDNIAPQSDYRRGAKLLEKRLGQQPKKPKRAPYEPEPPTGRYEAIMKRLRDRGAVKL
eukprot:gnl/TRDRNA2_/TRDRNA2_134221_c2_seq1.p1 gnl/TRDRNA2_/TRDRNA2_134221_c2~~gnl/TRDRNA2_/TRDRNA2_134221_c2_seq1.p1  ORF type:complete len:263 (+),score=47.53 gnl/TRDRNA2_/TRDRNA2_134221_c2_seq1:108-896(+)